MPTMKQNKKCVCGKTLIAKQEKFCGVSCFYKFRLLSPICLQTAYTLPKIKSTELAYIAGILDGEGSIVVDKKKDGKPQRIRLEIGNSSKEMLEWIRSKLNDSKVHARNPKHISKKGYGTTLQMYYLIIYKQRAVIQILSALLPFLIIKKKKALLAIEFIKERVTNARAMA